MGSRRRRGWRIIIGVIGFVVAGSNFAWADDAQEIIARLRACNSPGASVSQVKACIGTVMSAYAGNGNLGGMMGAIIGQQLIDAGKSTNGDTSDANAQSDTDNSNQSASTPDTNDGSNSDGAPQDNTPQDNQQR